MINPPELWLTPLAYGNTRMEFGDVVFNEVIEVTGHPRVHAVAFNGKSGKIADGPGNY